MLSDGVTAPPAGRHARDGVQVIDVAQLLLRSVKDSTPAPPGT